MNKKSFLLLSLFALAIVGCSNTEISLNETEVESEIKSEIETGLEGNVVVVDSTIEFSSEITEEVIEEIVLEESVEVVFEDESIHIETESGESIDVNVQEDGSVSIKSEEHSTSVSIDEEGTVVIDTDIDLSNVPNVDIADWCVVGQVIENEIDATTSVSFTIVGIVDFKDEKYCLSSGVVVAGTMEIATSIYAQGPTSGYWIVTEILGQTIEKRIEFQ